MKLHIVDYSWGVDRRSGQKSESIAAEVTVEDLKIGKLAPVGPARHVFVVDEIKDGAAVILLSEKAGKIELKVGQPYEYRPLSFDGGHFYRLELE